MARFRRTAPCPWSSARIAGNHDETDVPDPCPAFETGTRVYPGRFHEIPIARPTLPSCKNRVTSRSSTSPTATPSRALRHRRAGDRTAPRIRRTPRPRNRAESLVGERDFGSKADVSQIRDHSWPRRITLKLAAALADHSADNIEDDAVACCTAAGTAQQPDFAQHPG